MRITGPILAACLSTLPYTGAFSHGGRPEVPAGYPSHKTAGECAGTEQLTLLQQRLSQYNVTRLGIAQVLRKMADKYALQGETKDRLLAFADNFDDMQQHLPDPDPDSDEFRNFDFKLGLAFTALTVFLNTRDESLAKHFYDDRSNPASDLGLYLASLDVSRDNYMSSLSAAGTAGSPGTAPCH